MLFADNPEKYDKSTNLEDGLECWHEVSDLDLCQDFYLTTNEMLEDIGIIAETDGMLVTGDSVGVLSAINKQDKVTIDDFEPKKIMPIHFSSGAVLHRERNESLFRFTSRSNSGQTAHFFQLYGNKLRDENIIPRYVLAGKPTVISSLLVAKESRSYCEAAEYTLKDDNKFTLNVRHLNPEGDVLDLQFSDDNIKSFALFSLMDAYDSLVGDD